MKYKLTKIWKLWVKVIKKIKTKTTKETKCIVFLTKPSRIRYGTNLEYGVGSIDLWIGWITLKNLLNQ